MLETVYSELNKMNLDKTDSCRGEIACAGSVFLLKEVFIGGREWFSGGRRAVSGENKLTSGGQRSCTGGNSMFTGERVRNIKTRTVKTAKKLTNFRRQP